MYTNNNNNNPVAEYSGGHNCNCNIEPSQWYGPQITGPAYNFIMNPPPSNSREIRNQAEKMRRYKINNFISELAKLVPLISRSPKRMDKTSILRLAATFLRIYQTLLNGNGERMELPSYLDQFVLENLVCEQLGGFLLILTNNGKVVFVSQTVENILGHLQTDLMGQSVFNIISQEDHARFKTYLKHDFSPENDWRKYFNVRLKRAGPRNESPVYETVNVMGMQKFSQQNSPGVVECQSRDIQLINHDMWIFFIRLNRPEPITDQLIEASKDEYVTRHLVDGRIINCDQRISYIAGYMIEEVSGITAFKFMHRDDVRWVMIALRQMYDKGESRGSSCYRLLSRTGQFIYLQTFGFLEIDSTGTVESFICVNTLVPEKEGMRLITEMKQRYSALIKSDSTRLQITNGTDGGSVEDPAQLEEAIAHLITNLPSPDSENSDHHHNNSHEIQDCSSNHSTSTEYSSSSSYSHKTPIYFKMKTATKRPPSSSVTESSAASSSSPGTSSKRQRNFSSLTPPPPPQYHAPRAQIITEFSDNENR